MAELEALEGPAAEEGCLEEGPPAGGYLEVERRGLQVGGGFSVAAQVRVAEEGCLEGGGGVPLAGVCLVVVAAVAAQLLLEAAVGVGVCLARDPLSSSSSSSSSSSRCPHAAIYLAPSIILNI